MMVLASLSPPSTLWPWFIRYRRALSAVSPFEQQLFTAPALTHSWKVPSSDSSPQSRLSHWTFSSTVSVGSQCPPGELQVHLFSPRRHEEAVRHSGLHS